MITLGGDGTILHGVSLFLNVVVPPILSFAMGTLGFYYHLISKIINKHFEKFMKVEVKHYIEIDWNVML